MSQPVSDDLLKQLFAYNPTTGIVTRKSILPTHKVKVGPVVGSLSDGYLVVNVMNNILRLHRLGWLLHYGVWPDGNLDHVNGIRSDNRIANLRIADYYENQANTSVRVHSKSGIKGVSPYRGHWQATIRVRGSRFFLGEFDRKEDAAKAYQDAAKANFGEFAREEAQK